MIENETILISGAGGKTGLAVCEVLAEKGVKIRAWVRREAYTFPLRQLGIEDFIIGDLLDYSLAEESHAGYYNGLSHSTQYESRRIAYSR